MRDWAYCLPPLSRDFPTCKMGVKAAAHRVDVKAPCDESGAQTEPGKYRDGRLLVPVTIVVTVVIAGLRLPFGPFSAPRTFPLCPAL